MDIGVLEPFCRFLFLQNQYCPRQHMAQADLIPYLLLEPSRRQSETDRWEYYGFATRLKSEKKLIYHGNFSTISFKLIET